MTGEHGALGSQGSADPPVHVDEHHEMDVAPAEADEDRDGAPRTKSRDGAREPAPGEADPLSEPSARPGDKRQRWDV